MWTLQDLSPLPPNPRAQWAKAETVPLLPQLEPPTKDKDLAELPGLVTIQEPALHSSTCHSAGSSGAGEQGNGPLFPVSLTQV